MLEWTQDELETLKRAAADGLNAGQVARLLGKRVDRVQSMAKRMRIKLAASKTTANARRRAAAVLSD